MDHIYDYPQPVRKPCFSIILHFWRGPRILSKGVRGKVQVRRSRQVLRDQQVIIC